MIDKGAIEVAPKIRQAFAAVFSWCPRATERGVLIIDLSALNKYVLCPTFKMETPRSILRALREGQWLTYLDLKCLHIKIHPGIRQYCIFCHESTVWQLRALPLGWGGF